MFYPLQKFFFFFNDTATTEIYTLSLHDALPISISRNSSNGPIRPLLTRRVQLSSACSAPTRSETSWPGPDRKSTRLNSSHTVISYAVFCLKKKKTKETKHRLQ